MITFIRHAESVYNANPKDDTRDCALTEKGRMQSATLAGEFDVIYVSPLRRAQETLKFSFLRAPRVEIVHDLREVCESDCDLLADDVRDTYENSTVALSRARRCREWLLEQMDTHGYRHIAVVAHWVIIWYMTHFSVELDNAASKALSIAELRRLTECEYANT